jgi:Cu+-exporting ATPase
VDTIVLDKTGTITTGKMSLADIALAEGVDRQQALRLVGALERASEHPIAQAIATAAAAGNELPPVESFINREGLGVEGVVDGYAVVVGRPALLADWAIHLPRELEAAREAAETNGQTAIAAGWDGEAKAVLVVADTLKPTSAEAIERLKELGLRPVLLTGDNKATARAVAAEVGIDEAIAEVLPADKVSVVRRLQAQGRVVAMVGDGVNDAPALAHADLGLAIGTGTDVAIEGSDLTLISGDLRAAGDAIRLSRATLRTIKQNLAWGVRLQHRGAAARRARSPEPTDRRRRDGLLQRLRRLQRLAPAALPVPARRPRTKRDRCSLTNPAGSQPGWRLPPQLLG